VCLISMVMTVSLACSTLKSVAAYSLGVKIGKNL